MPPAAFGRTVVRWVKLGVGLALLGLLLGSALTDRSAPTPAPVGDVGRAPVACTADGVSSPVGFRAGAQTMALVRTPAGTLRVVPFQRGWAVYTGRAPGTFLRVCTG